MDYLKMSLEVAKTIGQPLDINHPVPVTLELICNVGTAEPGERVRYFSNLDAEVDEIYTIASDGSLHPYKVSPVLSAEVTFSSYTSLLDYILLDEVINGISGDAGKGNEDLEVFARKKRAITRALDKREVKSVLDGVMSAATEVAIGSGTVDIYDYIVDCVQALEDYGDNYVLLVGSKVKNKMDVYDKENAKGFNYRIGLYEYLKSAGITVKKVFGSLRIGLGAASGGAPTSVTNPAFLDTNKLIMVAKNSTIVDGLPITFIRRKLGANLAGLMGVDVDTAQRAIGVGDAPTVVAGSNVLGFNIWAYESNAIVITNPKAIVKSPDLAAVLAVIPSA